MTTLAEVRSAARLLLRELIIEALAGLPPAVGGGGPSAPVITTPSTLSIEEGKPFSLALEANEPVTWTITGGNDVLNFVTALSASGADSFDFEKPDDVGPTDNVYSVIVRATSAATGLTADKSITITVIDVPEGVEVLDFVVSPSTASTAMAVNATIGTVSAAISGVREKVDFNLSSSSVQDTATAGSIIGELV